MGGQGECGAEEETILAQEDEQEPTGGKVGMNSKITIIIQQEPPGDEVGMNSEITITALSG